MADIYHNTCNKLLLSMESRCGQNCRPKCYSQYPTHILLSIQNSNEISNFISILISKFISLPKRGSYDRLETLQSIIICIITKVSIPNLRSRIIPTYSSKTIPNSSPKTHTKLTIKNPYQTHHQKSIPKSPSKIHTELTIKNAYQTHHQKSISNSPSKTIPNSPSNTIPN